MLPALIRCAPSLLPPCSPPSSSFPAPLVSPSLRSPSSLPPFRLASSPTPPLACRAATAASIPDPLPSSSAVSLPPSPDGSQPPAAPAASAGAASAADRKALLHEALKQLQEEGLEEAAKKYDLHNELFAELDFARINAFSCSAFGGNPAAVVYLPYMPQGEEWLQKVAAEFNLSETAYVVRRRTSSSSSFPGAAGGRGGGGQGFGVKRAEDGRRAEGVSESGATRKGSTLRGNEFDLRWFTPTTEVKLCGHATLASAHLLFTAGLLEPECEAVVFHTLSGPLRARRVPEDHSLLGSWQAQAGAQGSSRSSSSSRKGGQGMGEQRKAQEQQQQQQQQQQAGKGRGLVELTFPLLPVVPLEQLEYEAVEEALGLSPGSLLFAGRTSLHYILAEVKSEDQVLALAPDFEAVSRLPAVGVMVTALSERHRPEGQGKDEGSSIPASTGELTSRPQRAELGRADFITRFFAPAAGIDEDPVTGSAFCSLGPYWAERLGKTQLLGFQASARGGEVAVTVDAASQQVHLQGWAVLVQAGVLLNTLR